MADEPKRNGIKWELASGFKDSWVKHKSDAVSAAMGTFDLCKRSIPPAPLPATMKDHKLSGPLKDYYECHLDGDVLLIYKPIAGGAIKLLRVCTHDDISGPRGAALAKILKTE
ncbi:type II toxin-antitoxin system mRNA interferase toxin, RelE/StbE family [Mesorhizobium sp. M2E.F.Ca.ET.209.01.1.1]|uniref:type II toxin-antitoxin system RelE/ParE family toxin n=1 Tax=Mesorhizobium sp. M2E.F.Ca.ET.209.01.1.1 TaxID=2500526 RepID=UPI001091D985|nr:type II toxin-antitoxin system mRNA interferase toxin, RelE/StbE family [Mesorhizobium sp. M2E.F.Ca.ET.209.01.1.1]TGS15894.1 type II toxin-antitoxin system mRNA interferase toxin, RelE/StbE family [Mesorhizobium sp. M2E.F.Ca.ET.209.01.1.1]